MTEPSESKAGLVWDDRGLIPVCVQDRLTGEIRMVAYADQAAVDQTIATGKAHFFSRSRGKPWMKGESSGHTLEVFEVWRDCDGDTLIYLADPTGPTCHTGAPSCFFQPLHGEADRAAPTLVRLWSALEERLGSDAAKSYTKSLVDAGPGRISDKLREEAGELSQAIANESDERVASEAADVIYHVFVGLLSRGVAPQQVYRELARRFGTSGHDEKRSR